jgi:hypothetical protein
LGECTADLEKKPAVVPSFVQFRLEFGDSEILADLPRHWQIDRIGKEAPKNFKNSLKKLKRENEKFEIFSEVMYVLKNFKELEYW